MAHMTVNCSEGNPLGGPRMAGDAQATLHSQSQGLVRQSALQPVPAGMDSSIAPVVKHEYDRDFIASYYSCLCRQ